MEAKQLDLDMSRKMPVQRKRYWKVPPRLYRSLDAEFHFDFDPCPYPRPDEWDGLKNEWGSCNFVNPPFKQSDGGPITRWVKRAIEQWRKGKTVVLLITSDTSTKWFAELRELELSGQIELRFIRGRVRFREVEDGSPGPSPMMGAMIVILRAEMSQSTKLRDAKE